MDKMCWMLVCGADGIPYWIGGNITRLYHRHGSYLTTGKTTEVLEVVYVSVPLAPNKPAPDWDGMFNNWQKHLQLLEQEEDNHG